MHFSVDVVIHYYGSKVPKEFTLLPVELNILFVCDRNITVSLPPPPSYHRGDLDDIANASAQRYGCKLSLALAE